MAVSELGTFQRALRENMRGDVSFDAMTRGMYATDGSIYQIMPVAVVLPRDEQDVMTAVQQAKEHGVGILPRGGGTSLGGQAVGAAMVVDLSKYMNRILELDASVAHFLYTSINDNFPSFSISSSDKLFTISI